MRLGIQIPDFTYPGGPATLAADLTRIAQTADDGGFDVVAVMDHFWQLEMIGPPEREMLEGWSTLAFLAGQTRRVQLLTLVTGTIYRTPGLLAKTVSTLDVLSGGRAMLGIGAAWYEQEAVGLGFPFPSTAERFERLEETLQVVKQMWSGSDAPYEGKHYRLGRTLNSPQPLRTPPIMIGGGGERKTLRLVAQYADMCNLLNGPDLPHKLDVLREHCEAVGRDYDSVEKTVYYRYDVSQGTAKIVDELSALAELGFSLAVGAVQDVHTITPLEQIASEVLPQVAGL